MKGYPLPSADSTLLPSLPPTPTLSFLHPQDGALLVDPADIANEEHTDEATGMTLSAYVTKIYGITHVTQVARMFVSKKRLHETEHLVA